MLQTVAIFIGQHQFAICGMVTAWMVFLGIATLASRLFRRHISLRWFVWTYANTGIGLSMWLFWTHFWILGGLSTRSSIPEAEYWNGFLAAAFCIINWPLVWGFALLYFVHVEKVFSFLVVTLALTLSISAGGSYLLTSDLISSLHRRVRSGLSIAASN
jgi:hypothetical protein